MEVQNIEGDNPHEKVRAPMMEVESYPRFIEVIPLLETDFFRSPIPEEERKEIIYKKIKNPNTRIQGNEDLEFAHTMRELLSDVASSITQSRINNLHKLMELPDRLTAKSRRNKKSPFCPRQQTAFGTTSVIAQTPHNATPNTVKNNQTTQSRTTRYVLSRLGQTHRQQMSQKHSREGIKYSVQEFEFREAKTSMRKKFIRNLAKAGSLLTLHLNRYKQKISKKASDAITQEVAALLVNNAIEQSTLYNTKKDRRPTFSSRPPETQQLCATPSTKLGSISSNQSIGIFGQPFNNRQVQGKMYGEYKEIILQTKTTGVQDQNSEFKSPIRQDTSNVGCSPPLLSNTEKTFGIKKKILKNLKSWTATDTLNKTPEIKIFIEASNTAWGIVVGSQSYSGLWPSSIVSAYINDKELLAVTFKQHYDSSIRTEIWGNYLPQITRSLRETVVSLYRDKHTSSDVLWANVNQPSRSAIKTDSSNGMVYIIRDIQETKQNI
ncbi:hypothetical protein BB561_005552 [Smittium simulii]|uniref:Uncharacterized protein n=1 Tax=Smittium simulii TaxID=133385 RepID=A0A2T9Y9V4_9FUNG|nr:hypothetical protein BB561_005552 [Smittium simulii]